MKQIFSPSLLSANFLELGAELASLEKAGVSWLHLDVMDGCFVPNITFGAPVISALRAASNLFFDVHLMIREPERLLDDFISAGADLLVVHLETLTHAQRVIASIAERGVKAGVSLNPATDLASLRWILPYLDLILIMGVNPGFSGQKFIPQTVDKIRECKKFIAHYGYPHLPVEVDGGVCLANLADLASAGADVLVSGSAFFKGRDYRQTLASFYREVDKSPVASAKSLEIVNSWKHASK